MSLVNAAPTMALIAGVGVLSGVAATAGAAEIKAFAVDSRPAQGLPAPQVLSFAQFDSALGDLTAVRFTLGAGHTSDTVAKVAVGSEGSTGTASVTADFSITAPGGLSLFADSAAADASCTSGTRPNPTTCADTSDPAPAVFPSLSVELTSALDAFENAGGGSFDVTVGLALGTPSCTGNFSYTCEFYAFWSGTLTVEFVFTPDGGSGPGTDVTEPETLALLGLSLFGLAAVSRRRRSA